MSLSDAAELEAVLGLAPNEPIGNLKSRLSFADSFDTAGSKSSASPPIKLSPISLTSSSSYKNPTPLSLHSYRDLPTSRPTVNSRSIDVQPNSHLELALIQVVLPHTPYLLIPLHTQRFLAQLSLPTTDPDRPHPALLYILFAEAVNVLEKRIPPPNPPRSPTSVFPHPASAPPLSPQDIANTLWQVQGMGLSFLERARKELDNGIRNVDRPFDLVRAAVGIARHLYGLGRFIEGWNIPVARLLVSCGIHRMSGNFIPPDGSLVMPSPLDAQQDHSREKSNPYLAKPYPPAHHYLNTKTHTAGPDGRKYPITRMRPVIIPPPRDEIELAERTMTFWAAKMQDWEAGCGWGWSLCLSDEECTTEWGWGWGSVEVSD